MGEAPLPGGGRPRLLAREGRLVVLEHGLIPRRTEIGAVALEVRRVSEQRHEGPVVERPLDDLAVAADVSAIAVRGLPAREDRLVVVIHACPARLAVWNELVDRLL